MCRYMVEVYEQQPDSIQLLIAEIYQQAEAEDAEDAEDEEDDELAGS